MYANKGNDGDGFGRKEIVERKEMEVRTDEKVFVCDDGVGEVYKFAITDETWLMGRWKKWKRGWRKKR